MNEVIGIDSTDKISKDVYSLTVFTCVNRYGLTAVSALCFHTKKSSKNFGFALNCYLEAGFNPPNIVFTDRAKALLKAIDDLWISTQKVEHYFLCIYHIYRNIQEYLGRKILTYYYV